MRGVGATVASKHRSATRMKAEHRKELQTNKLADVLGRTVRKVRSRSGIPWLKIGLVALVVGGAFLAYWLWNNKKKANSELWVDVESGTIASLLKLADKEHKDTNQGKVARFEIAYELLWNRGIKMLGVSSISAKASIEQGIDLYETLAKELKESGREGDPVLLPEALYSIAVGYEALAAFDEKALEEALKSYQELAKGDHAKSAYGQMAQKRAAQLSDPVERARILTFYREFATRTKLKDDSPFKTK
jgi:hypothetical protein